jgi:hypothetical protein
VRRRRIAMMDDNAHDDVEEENVVGRAPPIPTTQSVWAKLTSDALACKGIDQLLANKSIGALSKQDVMRRAAETTRDLHQAWLEHVATLPIEDLSDDTLRSYTRYTDGLPLKDYENALDLVPDLVNLVSLADALPLDGSGLPFNLKRIAARCKTAVYFAPRRFTAVQLAFDEPRSRVLLFRTFATTQYSLLPFC